MRRKLKQTAMALSFAGGAFLFGEAMDNGIENYGVQFEKLTVTEPQAQAPSEQLDARSEQLTKISTAYLVGSFMLIAAGGWTAVKLNDETIARRQTKLRSELLSIAASSEVITSDLFNTNRALMNNISEYDLRCVEFGANSRTKEVAIVERTEH